MTIVAQGDRLATVTALHAIENEPRELRHRHYDARPPATRPLAGLQFTIEEQLDWLFEHGQSPYDLLTVFAPEVAGQAQPLLDAVFEAADAVADRLPGDAPSWALMGQYADALFSLAECLRGAS